VHGCLWCLGSSTCQKATQNNVCDEEEQDDFGNSTSMEALSTRCRSYDAAPECNEKSDGNCRWCDAQSICRPTQLKCDSIGGNVKIELDKKDRSFFTIEDDGLGPTDPNRVSVGLSYLYEIDSTGGTIGSSIIDLAIQQFYLTQKVGSFWGNDEIKARKTSIRADITNVGSIEMEIYEILSGGTIHTGNETWNVVEGDVKFNVVLSDWRFCGIENSTCDTEKHSSYVDLALEVKGRLGSLQASKSSRLLLALGGNVPLLLSGQVAVDEMIESMPAGFPRVETAFNDTSELLVFRFPRFSRKMEYDPIVPYHTATLVDLNDAIIADDAQPTSAPTNLPTNSPNSIAPTGPTLVNDGSNGRSIPLIIGLVIGGFCLCLPSPFLVLSKLRHRRSSNLATNSEDPSIRAEDTNPEEGVWNDDGGMGDSVLQDAIDEPPTTKPKGPSEDSLTDVIDPEEGGSEGNMSIHPVSKHSHDGYPMDNEEEFSKDESFHDEADTDAEETSTTSSKSRPRLILSLRGFREAIAKTPSMPRRFSLKGFRDSLESAPIPPRLPSPQGKRQFLSSPTENHETTSSRGSPDKSSHSGGEHETQTGGIFEESGKGNKSRLRVFSGPPASSLALPHRLSLRGFEDEPIPTCPPMPRRVVRPSEDMV